MWPAWDSAAFFFLILVLVWPLVKGPMQILSSDWVSISSFVEGRGQSCQCHYSCAHQVLPPQLVCYKALAFSRGSEVGKI